MLMINLYDRRNDIFEATKAPRVLWVYRNDTFEVELELKVSNEVVKGLIFNTEQINSSVDLEHLENTEEGSRWLLTLKPIHINLLDMKQHEFSITATRADDTQILLYKGLLNVNNSISSNNPFLHPKLSERAPLTTDIDYLIGCLWVDIVDGSVYSLVSKDNDIATWVDLTNKNIPELLAEHVDTYTKLVIDNKDANTLQEAKDYTDILGVNIEQSKQDKLVAGDNITIDENTNVISASGDEIDLNSMAYFNYASRIYGAKYDLLVSAWEHSLTVDVVDKDHYPNGETEGVIIPQGVTSIDYGAFSGWWSNNQPLVIPDSVMSIETGAFFDWMANNHPLIIPNSVTSIGEAAFSGWSSVPYVEMLAITPPTIVSTSFAIRSGAPIYVPDKSVEAYKTATNWVNLADRIFPISDKVVSGSVLSDRLDAVESGKQDKLTAGDNITIDENNVISASGGSFYGELDAGEFGEAFTVELDAGEFI